MQVTRYIITLSYLLDFYHQQRLNAAGDKFLCKILYLQ